MQICFEPEYFAGFDEVKTEGIVRHERQGRNGDVGIDPAQREGTVTGDGGAVYRYELDELYGKLLRDG